MAKLLMILATGLFLVGCTGEGEKKEPEVPVTYEAEYEYPANDLSPGQGTREVSATGIKNCKNPAGKEVPSSHCRPATEAPKKVQAAPPGEIVITIDGAVNGRVVIVLPSGDNFVNLVQSVKDTIISALLACDTGRVKVGALCKIPGYELTYTPYSAPTLTAVCSGQETLTRSIYECVDNITMVPVDSANCAGMTDPTPTSVHRSPAGSRPFSIAHSNGSAVERCAAGSTTWAFDSASLTCNSGFEVSGQSCVCPANHELYNNACHAISYAGTYSENPVTLQVCGGSQANQRIVDSCTKNYADQSEPVANSFCEANADRGTTISLSPAGTILGSTIYGGNETTVCAEGDAVGVAGVSCSAAYRPSVDGTKCNYAMHPIADINTSFRLGTLFGDSRACRTFQSECREQVPAGSDPYAFTEVNSQYILFAASQIGGVNNESVYRINQQTHVVDVFFQTSGKVNFISVLNSNTIIVSRYVNATNTTYLDAVDRTTLNVTPLHTSVDSGWPSAVPPVVMGGRLYFAHSTASTGTELWYTDGTSGGTGILSDLTPGTSGTVIFNNTLRSHTNGYISFTAHTGSSTGHELYISNGPTGNTQLLKDVFPGSNSGVSKPAILVTHNNLNKLLFCGATFGNDHELWISDFTEAGTELLKVINPSTNAGCMDMIAQLPNGKVIFRGSEINDDYELFVTDGTAAGTELIINLNQNTSGVMSSVNWGDPVFAKLADGRIVYTAYVPPATGHRLFVTDGTAAGTTLFHDVIAGGAGLQISNLKATLDGSGVVLIGNPSATQSIYTTDGVTVTKAGDGGGSYNHLVPLSNGTFIFRGNESGTQGSGAPGDVGSEPWLYQP